MRIDRVSLDNYKGRIRLRFTDEDKQRHQMSLGLGWNEANLVFAQRTAEQINRDLRYHCFDKTLAKYKQLPYRNPYKSCRDLMAEFIAAEKAFMSSNTQLFYRYALEYLSDLYGDIDIEAIEPSDCKVLLDLFRRRNLSGDYISHLIGAYRSAWEWAIAFRMCTVNPWKPLLRSLPRQHPKPDPFTPHEVKAILEGFEADQRTRHLYPLVLMLFSCGVRLSEAFGLTWDNVSDPLYSIYLCRRWVKGEFIPMKGNKNRHVKLSQPIIEALEKMKAKYKPSREDFVFRSRRRSPLNARNFRLRSWQKILERAEVRYRSPRNTRSTYVTIALASGLSPLTVCQITGHSPAIMYRNYTGVMFTPDNPDILDLLSEVDLDSLDEDDEF